MRDDWGPLRHRDEDGNWESEDDTLSRLSPTEVRGAEEDDEEEQRRPRIDYPAVMEVLKPRDPKNAVRADAMQKIYRGWERWRIVGGYHVPTRHEYPDARSYRDDLAARNLAERRRRAAEAAWDWVMDHRDEIDAEIRRQLLRKAGK